MSHSIVSSISLHWSLRKAFLSLLAILWNSAFKWVYIFPFLLCLSRLFFSQLFVRPLQTTILPFGISFSWEWFWSLLTIQQNEPPSIVLQELCPSESLTPIIHLPCIIIRDLIQVIPEWSSGFPYFLQFKSEFGSKELMIEPQSAPSLVFADCIELLHLWLQRI